MVQSRSYTSLRIPTSRILALLERSLSPLASRGKSARNCTYVRLIIDLPERAGACRPSTPRADPPLGEEDDDGDGDVRALGSSTDRTITPDWSRPRACETTTCAKRTGLPPRARMVAGCCQGAVVPTKEAPTLAAPWTRTAAPGPSSSSMHRALSGWRRAGVVTPTVPRFKHVAPLKDPQGRDNC